MVIIHSTFISIILIGELKDGLFVKGKPEVIRNAEQIFEIFVHGQVLISLDTLAPAKYKSSSGDSELGNYSRAPRIGTYGMLVSLPTDQVDINIGYCLVINIAICFLDFDL